MRLRVGRADETKDMGGPAEPQATRLVQELFAELEAEARSERFAVAPNPCVGAAILAQGRVVARGIHREWGGPHAEIVALPSADEIMAMVHNACGADRLSSLRNYVATGTVRMVHMGVKGEITSVVETDGRYRDDMDLGKFGHIRVRVDDDSAWIDIPAMPDTDLHGEFFEQVALQHPLVWLGNWRETFTELHVREKRERDGDTVYVVRLKPPLGSASTLATWTPAWGRCGPRSTRARSNSWPGSWPTWAATCCRPRAPLRSWTPWVTLSMVIVALLSGSLTPVMPTDTSL